MLRLKLFMGLFFSFAGMLAVGCTGEKKETENILVFDRNVTETREPELVCQLSEDSIPLALIKDFAFLNNDSFVVVDGKGAYLYDISGTFRKQFGYVGRAGGEMLTPSCVYATSDLVYIWCSSLLKMLIFDHNANFKSELSGFERAVRKFSVDSNNEKMYLYTSGHLDDSGNKTIDVIDIYRIAEKSIVKSFEEKVLEDEILSSLNNSGGLYNDNNRFIYIHPGNLIVHVLDMSSEKTVQYTIEDKSFQVEEINTLREITGDPLKWRDYMRKNSVVKGLHKNRDNFIVVSEIGAFGESGHDIMGSRKTKLYLLDSLFHPVRTVLYDYIDSQDIEMHAGSMYFLTTKLDSDDQIITLNRFSLYGD